MLLHQWIPRAQRDQSETRSLEGIKGVYARFTADGATLKKAKLFNKVMSPHFSDRGLFFKIGLQLAALECPVSLSQHCYEVRNECPIHLQHLQKVSPTLLNAMLHMIAVPHFLTVI